MEGILTKERMSLQPCLRVDTCSWNVNRKDQAAVPKTHLSSVPPNMCTIAFFSGCDTPQSWLGTRTASPAGFLFPSGIARASAPPTFVGLFLSLQQVARQATFIEQAPWVHPETKVVVCGDRLLGLSVRIWAPRYLLAEPMQEPILDGVPTCLLLQKGGVRSRELRVLDVPRSPCLPDIGSWVPRGAFVWWRQVA